MKVSILATVLFLVGELANAQPAEEPQLLVESVECRGNHATSCEFIRSHLYLAAGMPLDEAEVRNAQLRLSSLRNFEAVDVRLRRGAQRNAGIVVIEVRESDPMTTEFLAGVSSRLDATRSVFAARLAHQNLFGGGETIDLSAAALTPLAGDAREEDYEVHLRYADPNLFGSAKYFAIARVSYVKASYRDIYGNFSDFDNAELDLRIGRRFGTFTYLTLGATYRPDPDWAVGEWDGGNFESYVRDKDYGLNVIYGWNSEDDLYFPTHGYSFHVGAGWDFGSGSPANRSHIQFRKTWHFNDSFLTVKLGGSPSPEYRTSFEESQLLSVSYGKPLQAGDSLKRGRWYVEPGVGTAGYYTPGDDRIYEVGIKAGLRLDTAAFGIVDLYVMASQDPQR